MKAKLIAILGFAGVLLGSTATSANAQRVSVNVNINQPQWAPYNNQANYYYIPSINVYYDVVNQLYYYLKGNDWRSRKTLPRQYSNVNLYNTYKVPMNTRNPFTYNNMHRQQYGKSASNAPQESIRDHNSNANNGRPNNNNNRPNGNGQSNNNRPNNGRQGQNNGRH